MGKWVAHKRDLSSQRNSAVTQGKRKDPGCGAGGLGVGVGGCFDEKKRRMEERNFFFSLLVVVVSSEEVADGVGLGYLNTGSEYGSFTLCSFRTTFNHDYCS